MILGHHNVSTLSTTNIYSPLIHHLTPLPCCAQSICQNELFEQEDSKAFLCFLFEYLVQIDSAQHKRGEQVLYEGDWWRR